MPDTNHAAVSSPEQIRQLIDKWRATADGYDRIHATMGVGWRVCAQELEALLRSGGVLPQQKLEDERTEGTRIGQTDVVSGNPPVPQRPEESHS